MMKLILKLRFEPEERLQERVLGSTRKFSELLHHYERIAKDERRLSTILEIREELLRYRLKELPDSEEEFIQLGGKVSERLDSLCLDGATPDVLYACPSHQQSWFNFVIHHVSQHFCTGPTGLES